MKKRTGSLTTSGLKITHPFCQFLIFLGKPFFYLILTLAKITLFFSKKVRFYKPKTKPFSPTILYRAKKNFFRFLQKPTTSFLKKFNSLLVTLYRFFLKFSPKKILQISATKILSFIKSFLLLPTKKLSRYLSPKNFFRLSKILPFSLGAALSLLTLYFLFISIFKDLPSPSKLSQQIPSLTTKIYDRHGNLLYKIYQEQNRTPVKLSELPEFVKQAVIAIEDKNFYHHHGIAPDGILRALYLYLFKGKTTGGSTITQQLVKNTLLTPEKTLRRKIKEIILALLVEQKYTKDEILEMYLNQVGFGGAAYGIEEASQKFFAKSAKDLTLPQAALLAGLIASPTRFSPFGAHPELAKERQALVLKRMLEDNYLTPLQYQEALAQKIVFAPQKTDIKAPHFVMYVKEILAQKYGEKLLETGGLEVTTSLDLNIQEKAQKIVKEEIQKLGNLHITNGAALVTNPKTGEILAMVGSKDYFAQDIDGNFNVTTALRQPGSAIKPVTYSLAFEYNFTPATIIDDSPVTYQVPGQPPYSPKNYDSRYHGPVPLRVALGSSYNVPAVKVLATLGVSKLINQGKLLGITSWEDPSRYGLSLTLGGGEVKMTELAVVYGVFANQGIKVELNPILEVKNAQGEILEKNPSGTQTPVLNPGIAYLITDILSDNSARTPAFGPNSQLYIPNRQVAVKTGTTQNLRDNWTIGYTPSFVVAVWVGNNDNSPMSWVASGVTGASPIWRKIMDFLLQNSPPETFPKPDEVTQVEICVPTGTLPCPECPLVKKEVFLSGTEPKTHCSPAQFQKNPSPKPSPQIL